MRDVQAPTPVPNGKATVPAKRPPRKMPTSFLQPPATLIEAIICAASDPNVDVSKVTALTQLHMALAAQDREAAFNSAMVQCQSDLQPVAKNQTNTHTSSRYADLAKLAEVALPIIHRHGFALTFGELEPRTPQHVGVAVRISHRDGHTHTSEFHVPHELSGFRGGASKTAVHSWGSALTYCRRYSLLCAFNVIVAGDDDGQAAGAKPASSASLKRSGIWGTFEADMRGAKSLKALEAVCDRWRPRMANWSPGYKSAAVELKGQQVERLGGTLAQLQESAEQFDRERYQEAIERDAAERRYELNRPHY